VILPRTLLIFGSTFCGYLLVAARCFKGRSLSFPHSLQIVNFAYFSIRLKGCSIRIERTMVSINRVSQIAFFGGLGRAKRSIEFEGIRLIRLGVFGGGTFE